MERLSWKKSILILSLLGVTFAVIVFTVSQNIKEREIFSYVFGSLQSINETSQETPLFEYLEILDSCNSSFEGVCVNVRKGPGVEFPVVTRLRNGIVLKVEGKIENNNEVWYKITFDEWLRYPERVGKEWYVSAIYVKPIFDEGVKETKAGEVASSSKRIIVDRSSQKIFAYDGETLFMEENISTGLEISPTPRGVFKVYKKTPSRYMQGPISGISEKFYDLPGVPWNLYFTEQGAVIHGAYWHDKFGQQWSSGCVNLSVEQAKKIYMWANLGTEVFVRD